MILTTLAVCHFSRCSYDTTGGVFIGPVSPGKSLTRGLCTYFFSHVCGLVAIVAKDSNGDLRNQVKGKTKQLVVSG